jgi:DNA-binding transcriptional LysR family regulator
MDRLMSMRVFQRVMDEGSFAAAARSLDMSAAVVTRLIADLEEHLAVRLLHRSTRKLAPTDAGETYLRRVRAILQDIDEADALASAHTQELSGTLRVLCQPVLATHVLAPLLAGFRQRYPQIAIDLVAEAFLEPAVEEHDIALFAADASFDGDIIARMIISTQTIFVASPEYLRRKGTPQVPQDLYQHDCLRLKGSQSRTRRWQLRSIREDTPTVDIDPPAALRTNHIDTLLRAALEGNGITIASVEMIAPYLAAGQLVHILPDWITGELVMLAALPTRKFLPQRTRVFLDFLIEQTRALVDGAACGRAGFQAAR